MKKSWGMGIIRDFFALIDRAVYGLMSTIYQIILELANVTILSSDVIRDIYSRVYALLAIFMLFKITFSFVNYVINPDQFTDRQKGVQNLIKNVIIVLVMIIITPLAFGKLQEAQSAILDDDLLPRLIIGAGAGSSTANNFANSFTMSETCSSSAQTANDGDFLALVTLRPFYQLEENTNVSSNFLSYYCPSGSGVTPSSYLKDDVYNESSGGYYVVDYKLFLSTLVGIVVCLILVSFCFDIAVRSIKLAFLQMIAPVPILSYIDPSSSKNGMFSKWIKQILSTWASLFIRLFAVFFAVLVISKIDISVISSQVGEHKFWVMLFILIGALIFAKQLPKLVEELIPGLKLGGLQLNPFKKVTNDALGGKQLLGAVAGAAGIGLGAASWTGAKINDKIKNGAENKEQNLAKRVSQAERRYGVGDPRTEKLFDKWGKAYDKLEAHNQKLNDKNLARENLTDLRGRLHIDEMALSPVTNMMKSLIGALTQTKDAAVAGYKQGASGKFNPHEIGVSSAKVRDYKDVYSIKDRVTDKATDFFGIKNDSGTTSKTSDDIKKNEEILTRINRNIEMMNKSFSDLSTKMGPAEFSKALSMNADGKYELNPNYNNTMYLNDIKNILTQMNSLEEQRLSTTKEIKRLQKIKDKTPGNKPK